MIKKTQYNKSKWKPEVWSYVWEKLKLYNIFTYSSYQQLKPKKQLGLKLNQLG